MHDSRLALWTWWLTEWHDGRLTNTEAVPPSPSCIFTACFSVKPKDSFPFSFIILDLYKAFF